MRHPAKGKLFPGGVMNILVLNGGSSSIKFSLFDASGEAAQVGLLLDGELSGIGTSKVMLSVSQGEQVREEQVSAGTAKPAETIGVVLDAIQKSGTGEICAVGHRVVHPGAEIRDHVRITNQVLEKLGAAVSFAPLHDPEAIALIREAMSRMPAVPHVACFDTVFHQTMPEEASTYAIPEEFRKQGIKRYGFHGLSCESIVRQMRMAGLLRERMVIAHLGSGCSVTAVLNGESIDTTMGLTPTGGVVMGTRPGDLDPGLMLYLLRQQPAQDAAAALEGMVNHQSGIVALSNTVNDVKAVRKSANEGDEDALLALKIFTRSVRKAIGGFAWLMGGLDAIVFSGGIGEHDPATRSEVLPKSEVLINPSLNQASGHGVRLISASELETAVFVVTAQEDLVIALHVKRVVQVDV